VKTLKNDINNGSVKLDTKKDKVGHKVDSVELGEKLLVGSSSAKNTWRAGPSTRGYKRSSHKQTG
jgi:hypothetical protein